METTGTIIKINNTLSHRRFASSDHGVYQIRPQKASAMEVVSCLLVKVSR